PKSANRNAVPQHRNAEIGAKAAKSLRFRPVILGVSLHIGNMDDLLFKQSSSDGAPASGFNRHGFGVLDKFGRDPIGLHAKEYSPLLSCNRGLIGVAKPGSRFYKRVEHGLQIKA